MTRLSDLKILVIENNAHMRAILTTILRAFGVSQIMEADTPLTGFALVATEDIDLVLLDFFLGDHDGYDMVALLRGERPCPNHDVPIIIITAAPQHPRVLAARELGADDILGKPVTPLEIFEVIDRVMSERTAAAA